MTLLNEMFDKLGAIGARSSFFMNQFADETENITVTPNEITNSLIKINTALDNMQENNQKFKTRIKEWEK